MVFALPYQQLWVSILLLIWRWPLPSILLSASPKQNAQPIYRSGHLFRTKANSTASDLHATCNHRRGDPNDLQPSVHEDVEAARRLRGPIRTVLRPSGDSRHARPSRDALAEEPERLQPAAEAAARFELPLAPAPHRSREVLPMQRSKVVFSFCNLLRTTESNDVRLK